MSKSLKNISVVATATVVSRVLGLVREIFIAAAFGTSALNSAFVSAFTLPNLFRRLLGEGALTAAFVPTNIAFAPNGDFYVADGYGSSYISQYSKDAKFIPGDKNGRAVTVNMFTGIFYSVDPTDGRPSLGEY